MTLAEEIGLTEGESLINHRSKLSGFLQNIDIDECDISDSTGKIIGSVVVTTHTDIKKPFKVTRTVKRLDL